MLRGKPPARGISGLLGIRRVAVVLRQDVDDAPDDIPNGAGLPLREVGGDYGGNPDGAGDAGDHSGRTNILVEWHEPDEARVSRPDVCPAKAGMFSRRKACRGKSQEPRSLDSRVAGNQDSEAYRQRLPWGGDESPGRNDSERESGLESE